MIVKKQRNIDFISIKRSLGMQLFAIETILQKTNDNIIRLNKIEKRNSKQEKELAFSIMDKETIIADLIIKRALHEEYMERIAMQAMMDKKEQYDYKVNHKEIEEKANRFMDDYGLPVSLREHLQQILSVKTTDFEQEQKIAWYLSLKQEVKMCEVYKMN